MYRYLSTHFYYGLIGKLRGGLYILPIANWIDIPTLIKHKYKITKLNILTRWTDRAEIIYIQNVM